MDTWMEGGMGRDVAMWACQWGKSGEQGGGSRLWGGHREDNQASQEELGTGIQLEPFSWL